MIDQEITIIDDTIVESELELYIEKLVNETKRPLDVIQELVNGIKRVEKTTIPEIEIKNMVSISRKVERNFYRPEFMSVPNHLIMPVVNSAIKTVKELLHGGAQSVPSLRRMQTQKHGDNSITVSFDKDTLINVSDNSGAAPDTQLTIAAGSMINIVAFKTQPITTSYAQMYKAYKIRKQDAHTFGKEILLSHIYPDIVQDAYFINAHTNNAIYDRLQNFDVKTSLDTNRVNEYFEQLLANTTSKEAAFIPRIKAPIIGKLTAHFVAPPIQNEVANPQLALLEKNIGVIAFPHEPDAILAAIYHLGVDIMKNYVYAQEFGEDSNDAFFKRFHDEREYKKLQHEILMNLLEREDKSNSYMQIIAYSLGEKYIARINDAIAKNPSLKLDPDNLLEIVGAKERKIVQNLYAQRIKYFHDLINNTCAHVKLIKHLNTAPSKLKKYLEDLYHYIDPKTRPKEGIIKCNVCGFDLICTHKLRLLELEKNNATLGEINKEMQKYFGMGSDIYCKYCFEIIKELTKYDHTLENVKIPIDDDLRAVMWGEFMDVSNLIAFKELSSTNTLFDDIISSVYVYIENYAARIEKSKSASEADINNKIQLFAFIYILMYFVISMQSGKTSNYQFKNYTGKPILSDLIKFSIVSTINVKNIVINRLSDINNESIKNIVILIYKQLSETGIRSDISTLMTPTINKILDFLLDPLFKYIIYYNYEKFTHAELQHPRNLPKLLGIDTSVGETALFTRKRYNTLDVIKAAHSVYDGVKMAHISRPKETDIENMTFWLIMDRVFTGLYKSEVFQNGVQTAEISAYLEVVQKLQNYEAEVRETFLWRFIKPNFYTLTPRAIDYYNESSYARIYDEAGHAHRFNILILEAEDGSAKTEESMTPILGYKLVDYRCSVCRETRTEAYQKSSTAAYDAHVKLEYDDTILNYFKQLCPASPDEKHNFDTKTGVCKNCGYGAENPEKFITKYKEQYEKDTHKKYEPLHIPPPPELKKPEELNDWKYDFGVILEASDVFKIESYLLNLIGATEGAPYDTLAKYISPPVKTGYDWRIYCLKSIMMLLVIRYNKFCNTLDNAKIDPILLEEFNKVGLKKHEYALLHDKLEMRDYYDSFTWLQLNGKPTDVLDYELDAFYKMCVRIATSTSSSDKRVLQLRKYFVKEFLNEMVENDRLMCKAGYFSWSILYPITIIETPQNEDENESDGDEDDEDEEGVNIFKGLENFTQSDDKDPDEEEGNIHVGSDYGLD